MCGFRKPGLSAAGAFRAAEPPLPGAAPGTFRAPLRSPPGASPPPARPGPASRGLDLRVAVLGELLGPGVRPGGRLAGLQADVLQLPHQLPVLLLLHGVQPAVVAVVGRQQPALPFLARRLAALHGGRLGGAVGAEHGGGAGGAARRRGCWCWRRRSETGGHPRVSGGGGGERLYTPARGFLRGRSRRRGNFQPLGRARSCSALRGGQGRNGAGPTQRGPAQPSRAEFPAPPAGGARRGEVLAVPLSNALPAVLPCGARPLPRAAARPGLPRPARGEGLPEGGINRPSSDVRRTGGRFRPPGGEVTL